uniref:Integrase n=1 Tax=Streptococcus suis TaxID=1307 RepID=A0A1P8VRN2_STRSU|nr:Integrase [Streptococcus suis]APZ79271.1 Integrase [Streptococcus suis]
MIEAYYQEGTKVTDIMKALGKSKQTVVFSRRKTSLGKKNEN